MHLHPLLSFAFHLSGPLLFVGLLVKKKKGQIVTCINYEETNEADFPVCSLLVTRQVEALCIH